MIEFREFFRSHTPVLLLMHSAPWTGHFCTALDRKLRKLAIIEIEVSLLFSHLRVIAVWIEARLQLSWMAVCWLRTPTTKTCWCVYLRFNSRILLYLFLFIFTVSIHIYIILSRKY